MVARHRAGAPGVQGSAAISIGRRGHAAQRRRHDGHTRSAHVHHEHEGSRRAESSEETHQSEPNTPIFR